MFRTHWPLVLGYLVRRTGDRAVAEDLAQETFMRATKAFLGWRGGRPEAWLLAIARNVLIDHRRRGLHLVPIDTLQEVAAPLVDLEAGIDMEAALRRLPPPQSRLLRLVYMDGFTLGEVAVMTGSTEGAVKTAVWRARAALRATYEGVDGDEET